METSQVCGKCGQRSGKPYEIYYGKAVGKEKINKNGQEEIVDIYEKGGSESIFICDTCIRTNRTQWVLGGLAMAVIGGPFLIAVSKNGLGLLFGGMAIIVGIWAAYAGLTQSQEEMGSGVAVNLRKNDLMAKGFEKTWKPSEFKKVHQKTEPGNN